MFVGGASSASGCIFAVGNAVPGVLEAAVRLDRDVAVRCWMPVTSTAQWFCSGSDKGTDELVAFQTQGGAWWGTGWWMGAAENRDGV
jgi:hypothetical protein